MSIFLLAIQLANGAKHLHLQLLLIFMAHGAAHQGVQLVFTPSSPSLPLSPSLSLLRQQAKQSKLTRNQSVTWLRSYCFLSSALLLLLPLLLALLFFQQLKARLRFLSERRHINLWLNHRATFGRICFRRATHSIEMVEMAFVALKRIFMLVCSIRSFCTWNSQHEDWEGYTLCVIWRCDSYTKYLFNVINILFISNDKYTFLCMLYLHSRISYSQLHSRPFFSFFFLLSAFLLCFSPWSRGLGPCCATSVCQQVVITSWP